MSSPNTTDASTQGRSRAGRRARPAPDFLLRDQFGQDVRLSSFVGKKTVALVFYPWAFSNVCTSEMDGIRDRLDEFLTFDTEVLAISTDPTYSLRVFADTDGLNFPLLSDFWPHGAVAPRRTACSTPSWASPAARRSWSTAKGSCGGRSTTRCPIGATWGTTWPISTIWTRPAGPFSIRCPRPSGVPACRWVLFSSLSRW